ncbi:RdRP-domain-containing protein [Pleurotus eryngii]|uniref:RNA-dependent RNA polymerase n=1 Tax=Pleurotus eryngii TaxID=5323 RepID=A0A9P5ZP14_PLEER|nr:RdRP-domain-containing protein [Pleurotus eryngii]
MQIFMRNVAFKVKEDDLKLALANIIHRPPFPLETKINFHVELFRQPRSDIHRGIGLLTLPSADIGEHFLATMHRLPFSLQGRQIHFCKSTRTPNQPLIIKVATSEWEDPIQLQQKRQLARDNSAPITLSAFSFGRFCRDGVFSPEVDMQGRDSQVICDLDTRQLRLTVCHPWFTSVVHYSASSVAALANPPGTLGVFIEAENPPIFSRQALSEEERPQRLSSVNGLQEMPPVARAVHLLFRSNHELQTFKGRCVMLYLPRLIPRNIPIEPRNLYERQKRTALNTLLCQISFPLAFEIEKAIYNGALDPTEVIEGLGEGILVLNGEHNTDAGPIFNSFVMSLGNPGIETVPIARRPRRNRRQRGKKKRVDGDQEAVKETLAQRLVAETETYIARQYQPRGRLSVTPVSAGIYQCYHVIITPTSKVLEGPLPDQSNSVLRRFGNHECFLRVSFQDEIRAKPRRDPSLLIDDLLELHYKPFLVQGIEVAGQRYEFLGYSMSGLKDYGFSFVRKFEFQGAPMDAQEIREELGDFSHILHRPALLGARWAQAFSSSDPSVVLEPEEIKRILDRKSATDSLFTDGCGTISPVLCRAAWRESQKGRRRSSKLRNIPSALQFRLGGAKGILVQDPRLTGRVVCLRPSQIKFEGSMRSLDISTTSARPIAVYLNRAMIALLEHHGVDVDYIFELQQTAIEEVQSIKDSLSYASALFNQHGLGASFKLPSLFGDIYNLLNLDIHHDHGLNHQLIITCLHYAIVHLLRDIKHRAHILVPGSYTLIGVSDEWDCLEEGEIYATVYDERRGIEDLPIVGDVLITRSPQIHPGDLQMVTAVRRPRLAHLRNVVVFSCKGNRSLPSMLGGGDLDGDIYNLIVDPNLHPPSGRTTTAGAYIGLDKKTTEHPCTVSDVADFIIDFIKADVLGQISILHLRIADIDGIDCEKCLLLAEKASHAVDFPKTGTPVDSKSLPRPPDGPKPDFLSGEGVNPEARNYYHSTKLLGRLYRNVPKEQYHPNKDKMHVTDGERIMNAIRGLSLVGLGLQPIDVLPNEDVIGEMQDILEEYSTQLHTIAKAHCTSKRPSDSLSEAELVSGTIQAKWADHRRRREAVIAMNLQTQDLTTAIRRELRGPPPPRPTDGNTVTEGDSDEEDYEDWTFHEDFDNYDNFYHDQEWHSQTFTRAHAAFIVSQEALDDDCFAFGPSSFGLIAIGVMLDIVKARRKAFKT